MDVTPLVREGLQLIQSYNDQGFRISGSSYSGAVLVYPESTINWDGAADSSDLTLKSFAHFIEHKNDIDVVLLGTGAKMQMLPGDIRQALASEGLMIECMDTGAACRTFNVLVAEGRRVAAGLLATCF